MWKIQKTFLNYELAVLNYEHGVRYIIIYEINLKLKAVSDTNCYEILQKKFFVSFLSPSFSNFLIIFIKRRVNTRTMKRDIILWFFTMIYQGLNQILQREYYKEERYDMNLFSHSKGGLLA